MKKHKTTWKDTLTSLGILIAVFFICLFLASLATEGDVYGVTASFLAVLTYAAIIKAVWGYPDMSSIKKLQVNMANIRKKLGIRPGENRYIINELGVGYRMQDGNEG